ncbi:MULTISPECIES: ABC transporter permease [unclassified Microbacterium]|uniref:ABC transporter permease n=1 Tax=unclassified Microbacterium TaxID=2609290 RepID=UPI00214B5DA0|nr:MULTISPECIES: ABC transporter permease [unclassified Microbacterium]MCR2785215.1 ABC transporter permease [Microbacterium sp. zg.B96]MDL5352577.1 ABC transporter permease [Microbacterium sp. zg-YB36]WIM16747.1 ABC transporter permease [Microbacterium sp. zg-B96]
MDSTQRFTRLSEEPFATIESRGLRTDRRGGKLAEIFAHRELLGLLVRRDLQARYRDSFLGFLWTLIKPIIQFMMYFVVLGQFLRAAEGIPDFAVYLFAGLVLYTFFSDMVFGSTTSILANSGLVKKIYLPREVFPLASVGAASFMFAVQVVVLLVAAIGFQALPQPVEMLWFFPSVLLVLVYGLAIGLLLSALNVYLRDVQYLTEVVMMLAMWGSPIVYSWSMVKNVFAQFNLPDWLLEVYINNPITLGVLGFHRAFWGAGTAADYPEGLGMRMLIAGVLGLILLVISHRVFTRLQGNFAQEL